MFLGYDCAISIASKKRINTKWKELKIHRWTGGNLLEIAKEVNPIIRGIYQYYGKYKMWKLGSVVRQFHFRLVKWVINKYKRFGRSYKKGYEWLRKVRDSFPYLFHHWSIGVREM